MNDIRDALRKAGLISSRDEKRFQHEERLRKQELGSGGLKQEREEQARAHKERQAEARNEVKRHQEQHNSEESRRSQWKETVERLREEAVKEGLRGPHRFHYRDPDGFLPFLSLSDALARRIEQGELSIVQNPEPPGGTLIVPTSLADRLRDFRPELVLHCTRG